jgi:hypothetical protein
VLTAKATLYFAAFCSSCAAFCCLCCLNDRKRVCLTRAGGDAVDKQARHCAERPDNVLPQIDDS